MLLWEGSYWTSRRSGKPAVHLGNGARFRLCTGVWEGTLGDEDGSLGGGRSWLTPVKNPRYEPTGAVSSLTPKGGGTQKMPVSARR